MEGIDYGKKFQDICELQDAQFISLCDAKIAEGESKMRLCQLEIKSWEEIKKHVLDKNNNGTSSTK